MKQESAISQTTEAAKPSSARQSVEGLSLVMMVRNGASMLEQVLSSCNFVSEIVIVDDFSQDNTVEIAKRFGAKIFQRALNNDWAAQQNFAMQQATGRWVLMVDHDEIVSPELAEAIKRVVQLDKPCVYSVRRVVRFKNVQVKHGMFRPDWVARLFPREGTSWKSCVHPDIVSSYPHAKLEGGELYHYSMHDLPQYWHKMDWYAQLAARKNLDKGKRIRPFLHIILRPIWSFLQSYILWLGFLDGTLGWYFAWQYANYTLNKYMQLYLLQRNDGQL